MNRNRLILLGALLLIAVVTQWAVTHYTVEPQTQVPLARSDYILEDFRLSAMDDKGAPRFVLEAPKLERLPGEEAATVDSPRLWLYQGQEMPWEMEAKSAWIGPDAKHLRLDGDVQLVQNEPSSPTLIQGHSIAIWPDRQQAESDRQVTVSRPGEYLQGTGLNADLASARVELKADVKARYAPNQMDTQRPSGEQRGAGQDQ